MSEYNNKSNENVHDNTVYRTAVEDNEITPMSANKNKNNPLFR